MSKLLKGAPHVLYKYRDYLNEWNRKTLFNYELYLAPMSSFNDPFEGKIPFRYAPEDLTPDKIFIKLLESARINNPNANESELHEIAHARQSEDFLNDDAHIDWVDNEIWESIENRFGILSLTKNPINYLMWSHYAKSHTGYTIGFDTDLLFKTLKGCLSEVIYDDQFPLMSMFSRDATDFHKLLITKSPVWEYEGEYRVTKAEIIDRTIVYPKEMIKEIFLGCAMPLKHKQEVIAFVKKEEIDCCVFELSLSKERFELDRLRIY